MKSLPEALKFIKDNNKVAIVGLSPKPERPSNKVADFLMKKGFDVTPINPKGEEILGKRCKPGLSELVPGEVDWIDIFVNPKRLMGLVDEIIRLSPKLVWCQLGVVDEEFNRKMDEANIPYIADYCPKRDWMEDLVTV